MIATAAISQFVELDVPRWAWVALLVFIGSLLAIDILVVHRRPRTLRTKDAVIESLVWISIGLAFTGVIAMAFGPSASGEYLSGYLIEIGLSVDNIFVWALILGYFKIPTEYHHRVLFGGIFVALVLRAIFIFAGVALLEAFSWILYLFGAFLLYTAITLIVGGEDDPDPASSRLMKSIRRIIPTAPALEGQRLITRHRGRRVATPLFVVLVFIEFTDVLFAVDSVPAVLAVSREQFLVFSSNAWAILGLRALFFLVANARAKFRYLQEGVAVILSFVGIKMLVHEWVLVPAWLSLAVIGIVLLVAITWSLTVDRGQRTIQEG